MHTRLSKFQVALLVLIVLIGLVGIALLSVFATKQATQSDLNQAEKTTSVSSEQDASEIDSSDPFARLTIPYLRSLTYESKLGELSEYQRKANYTSYLTEYQSEGLRINGLLTIPDGEQPAGGWPAIVFVHGYIPPDSYQTTQKYVEYVDYLARNGFVVFKIDLRGHGDSEGEANGAYYSSDYMIDTLNARAALQAADFVNPEKIGLWGHSMAGNVVLRSLAVKPEIPAAVIWAGAVYSYSDWQEYGLSDHSFVLTQERKSDRDAKRQALYDTHGQFDPSSSFWQQVAATNYLQDLKGSIQFHHAVDDSVVNIGYSRDLMQLLDATTVPHQLYEYASGGHNISGGSFSQAMGRTTQFFSETLN